jgi:hypothetical protein
MPLLIGRTAYLFICIKPNCRPYGILPAEEPLMKTRSAFIPLDQLWNQPCLTAADFPMVLQDLCKDNRDSGVVLACSNKFKATIALQHMNSFWFITVSFPEKTQEVIRIQGTAINKMSQLSMLEAVGDRISLLSISHACYGRMNLSYSLIMFNLKLRKEVSNSIICELPVGNKSIDLVALKKVRHQVYCIQVSATQYTVNWIKGYKMLKVVQRPLAIHIESLVTFSQIDGKIFVFEVLKTDKPGDQYYRKFEIKTVAYKII